MSKKFLVKTPSEIPGFVPAHVAQYGKSWRARAHIITQKSAGMYTANDTAPYINYHM